MPRRSTRTPDTGFPNRCQLLPACTGRIHWGKDTYMSLTWTVVDAADMADRPARTGLAKSHARREPSNWRQRCRLEAMGGDRSSAGRARRRAASGSRPGAAGSGSCSFSSRSRCWSTSTTGSCRATGSGSAFPQLTAEQMQIFLPLGLIVVLVIVLVVPMMAMGKSPHVRYDPSEIERRSTTSSASAA